MMDVWMKGVSRGRGGMGWARSTQRGRRIGAAGAWGAEGFPAVAEVLVVVALARGPFLLALPWVEFWPDMLAEYGVCCAKVVCLKKLSK